jgi:D-alanyl-lipoteichoic acid biosynthesis protein DltB
MSKYSFIYGLPPFRRLASDIHELAGLRSGIYLIGISYFIFKAIHYLCDVSAGLITNLSFLRFLNFAFFFPTLTSGPMDRFNRFSGDMDLLKAREDSTDFNATSEALFRIASGLFKKFVLATLLLKYALNAKSSEELSVLSTPYLIKGAYAYSFLLYFDFSGYSDMAIGLARLMRIQVPENFDSPFLSLSIQEFWNRWHITLSQWIRDYIFNPFSRLLFLTFPQMSPVWLSSLAIFTAFLLCGVWHGDGLNFLIWGGLHGLALSANMLYRDYMKKHHREFYRSVKERRGYKILCWTLTFNFVVLSLVIFSLDWNGLNAVVKTLAQRF